MSYAEKLVRAAGTAGLENLDRCRSTESFAKSFSSQEDLSGFLEVLAVPSAVRLEVDSL